MPSVPRSSTRPAPESDDECLTRLEREVKEIKEIATETLADLERAVRDQRHAKGAVTGSPPVPEVFSEKGRELVVGGLTIAYRLTQWLRDARALDDARSLFADDHSLDWEEHEALSEHWGNVSRTPDLWDIALWIEGEVSDLVGGSRPPGERKTFHQLTKELGATVDHRTGEVTVLPPNKESETTTDTIPTMAPDLLEGIAALTAEAKALLPLVTDFSERARTTREEYRAELAALGVDPDHVDSDLAAERDGLDALGDAINDLQVQLASVFENYII